MLVSLETARQHLRVLDAAEDALISLYLAAAEDQAVQFLGRNVYPDALTLAAAVLAGDLTAMQLNASVEAAVLLICGHLYMNREAVILQGGNAISLPMGVHSLLQPYRVGLGV